ncbi:MAG: DUF4428 domain-containing protein [Actinomycetaceae bacterium]|nr:DUF4428 domain-containing protein [Actinomycetaceae bacterium]
MGLFDKKVCELCGEKAGMLTKLSLQEGFLCGDCKKKLSDFSDGWKQKTVANVQEHLAAREANKQLVPQFRASRELGPDRFFHVDDAQGRFLFAFGRDFKQGNPQIFQFGQMAGVRVSPLYDSFSDDRDGDGIPDHVQRSGGAASTAATLTGALGAIGAQMGGSFGNAMGSMAQGMGVAAAGGVNAQNVQGLAMANGLGNVFDLGTDGYDMKGFPKEVDGFKITFLLNDPYIREVVFQERGSDHQASSILQQCAAPVQAALQMMGQSTMPMGGQPMMQPGMPMQQAGMYAQPGMPPQMQPGMQPGMPMQQPGMYQQPGVPGQMPPQAMQPGMPMQAGMQAQGMQPANQPPAPQGGTGGQCAACGAAVSGPFCTACGTRA